MIRVPDTSNKGKEVAVIENNLQGLDTKSLSLLLGELLVLLVQSNTSIDNEPK